MFWGIRDKNSLECREILNEGQETLPAPNCVGGAGSVGCGPVRAGESGVVQGRFFCVR
jgi:hypothetical protein